MILKLAQNGLFAKRILKFKKEEIVNTFLSKYPESQLKNLVEEAYGIRQKWAVLKENKTLNLFNKQAKIFPRTFKEFIIAKA